MNRFPCSRNLFLSSVKVQYHCILILGRGDMLCKYCELPSYCPMCSLAVSTQDSPAVEPRSNPGSGKILMSENLRLYTTSPLSSCHVLIDKVLSSD